jgi:hypothetical protein
MLKVTQIMTGFLILVLLVICLLRVQCYQIASIPLFPPLPLVSSILISTVGHAQISSSTKPLLLCDVLVAPDLIKNLISVRRFTCDNLVSIEFDPFGLFVKDFRSKEEITHFDSSRDLYSIHSVYAVAQPSSMVSSVNLWHHLFGHPHTPTMSSLLSEFSLPCNGDTHTSMMTHKYRGSQQSSREVKPKFIDSTQGEPKNIYKP